MVVVEAAPTLECRSTSGGGDGLDRDGVNRLGRTRTSTCRNFDGLCRSLMVGKCVRAERTDGKANKWAPG